MTTTIHHVADCADCRRSTLHQAVIEHAPDRRALSKQVTCQRCSQHMEDRDFAAPVLDMINARSARERLEAVVDLGIDDPLGAIAN